MTILNKIKISIINKKYENFVKTNWNTAFQFKKV